MEIKNSTSPELAAWMDAERKPTALDRVREAAQWGIERHSFRKPIIGDANAYHTLPSGDKITYFTVSNGRLKMEGVGIEFDGEPLTHSFDESAQAYAARQAGDSFVKFCLSLSKQGQSLIWRKEPELSAHLTDDGLQFVFYARLAWVD